MKTYICFLSFLLVCFTHFIHAQDKANYKAEDNPTFFTQKKLRIGLAWNNGWSSVIGNNLPERYFFKPSVGLKFQADYYFNNNWGINIGLAYQQRGAIIYTPDFVKEVGNGDSTYRYRLRINSFEIPVLLIWRQANPTIGGSRFTAGLGLTPAFIPKVGTIFHSVEDGFHINQTVTAQYTRFDMLAQAQFGIDINAAESCLLQVQLYYQQGFINAYKSASFPNATGVNSNFGIKLGFMF